MRKVLGVANFGLLDKIVCQDNELLADEGFTLADVLLPQGILGRITTGEEAESQRAHTGLPWPMEANIHTDTMQYLRRAPLPVLWRALVEHGDRFAVWKTSDGADYSIGRMLAQSICDAYFQAEKQLASMDSGGFINMIPARPQAVVAIPNALDETGQDALLRECIGLGMPEPYLIWRPVAAALAWLQDTESELRNLIEPRNHNDDHIHVLYFGADALEFTTLRLRRYMHNDTAYILPLRDRPLGMPQLAGMDWAGNVMESLCGADDFGAYWQLFTTFPEVWQALAARPFDAEGLPRPWSTARGWQFWNPGSMDAAIQNAPANASPTLRAILKPSCVLKRYAYGRTFPEQTAQEIEKLSQSLPSDALHGVIACGPLLSEAATENWLGRVLAPIPKTSVGQYSKQARTNAVWLSPGNTVIAKGAFIYGERRLADIPAYLDTMPQLSLFTETKGKRHWHPLLDAQVVLGGEEFKDEIEGKFELPSKKRQLEILLCKGAVPQNGDTSPLTPPGLSACQARLVRHWVRTQGRSYENVQNNYNKLEQWARDYALDVAADLFSDGSDAREQANMKQDETETPFRNNIINFPSASDKNILLDVRVNMKPAAGLARVSFTPRDTNFLGGRSIRMNYATMKSRLAPPKAQRGWPALLEIPVHPEDPALCRSRNVQLIDDFEELSPATPDYVTLITEIQNKCLKGKSRDNWGIMFFDALYPITEKGECCTKDGAEQLLRIANKFSQDFDVLLSKRDEKTIERVLSRATWMYLATPQNIVAYIREALTHDHWTASMHNTLIESAGKCFQTVNDIHLLFEQILMRAGYGKFPIQSLRAASRLLRYQENSPAALTEITAYGIAQLTISLMQKEAQAKKFKQSFFQGVLLLLYLLRFRKVSDYFSIQNHSSMAFFEKGMGLIQQAIDYFIATKDRSQMGKAKAALKDFEDFVHQRATGSYPQAVLDLTGDEV